MMRRQDILSLDGHYTGPHRIYILYVQLVAAWFPANPSLLALSVSRKALRFELYSPYIDIDIDIEQSIYGSFGKTTR